MVGIADIIQGGAPIIISVWWRSVHFTTYIVVLEFEEGVLEILVPTSSGWVVVFS